LASFEAFSSSALGPAVCGVEDLGMSPAPLLTFSWSSFEALVLLLFAFATFEPFLAPPASFFSALLISECKRPLLAQTLYTLKFQIFCGQEQREHD
jgi:hypothetical protein